MSKQLEGKKVAFLAADGVEHSELTKPWKAVKDAGAEPELISLKSGSIKTVENELEVKDEHDVDVVIADANVDDYDALVLPGGVANPDTLRGDDAAVEFVRAFVNSGKPVAAICHGPWLLVEAGAADGRTLTSWPTLRTDIENAGGTWVDEEVHVDEGIVTSRKPEDLDAFSAKLIEEIQEGRHPRELVASSGSTAS